MTNLASFASELRMQCSRFASISQVCEGAGINRQQFNKYLSGQMLPSARTLHKICNFMGVSEQVLLAGIVEAIEPSRPPEQASARPRPTPLLESDRSVVAAATMRLAAMTGGSVGSAAGKMKEGHYYCHFPLHTSSDVVLRVLLTLRNKSGVLGFSRRTYFPVPGSRRHFIARGKHTGVVLAGGGDIYFIAVNTRAPSQISYSVVSEAPVGASGYFSGLAITRTTRSHFASTIALQYIGGSVHARSVLRQLGPVRMADPSLDPIIRTLMSTKTTSGPNQLHAIDFDRMLPEEAAATFRELLLSAE